MKRTFLFLFICFTFPNLVIAQPRHFTFTANTGDSYSIVVTNATLDGSPLEAGDEIGVLTPAGLVVGASVWTGAIPLALTAWIDDSQTTEVDGYKPGETMSFKIWDQSSDKEFPATPTYALGNGTFGDGAFASVALAAVSGGQPSGLLVTNTDDTGSGSLRDAIEQANTHMGADTIRFAIPNTDPGFDADAGVWTIRPQSPLPVISDSGVVVDGSTQAESIGADTNPSGPEIVINGALAGQATFGLLITSADNVLRALVINGFRSGHGIYLDGEQAKRNVIMGNYIGTNAAGADSVPNDTGIYLQGASENIIGGSEPGSGNVISGNLSNGISTGSDSTNGNWILGNFIGTDMTGKAALGNGEIGISLVGQDNIIGGEKAGEGNLLSGNLVGMRIFGSDNTVIGNHIGTDITGTVALGNAWEGLGIWDGGYNVVGGTKAGERNIISGNNVVGIDINGSDGNQVLGNYIGTDSSGAGNLGNKASGVAITGGSKNNIIGPQNILAHNGWAGVFVIADSTIQNTITQNSITNNHGPGIDNSQGRNTNLSPPSIISMRGDTISGTAPSNTTVEIFSDPEDEGMIYEGTVVAGGDGKFQWIGTPTGPYATATATDAAGNTSVFSSPVLITAMENNPTSQTPIEFSLSQNYPNPFNPETVIDYEVPRKTRVVLRIVNLLGEEVIRLIEAEQDRGYYSVNWNGTDRHGRPAASGVYLYRLEAGDFVSVKKMILIR